MDVKLSTLYTMMRAAVSGEKYRLRSGPYDLDLTYITERVIAMGFPAEGVESAYRNWIDDVAGYLKERHTDSFMIFNLCEREYSSSKFDHQVHQFAFPDHHPPPLALLCRLCASMHSWLASSPLNVVVVHCLAGKGRTGTVIAAFLVYAGLFDSASQALNFFASKRSSNNWGVTSPSQKRAVQYFTDMVVNGKVPHGKSLRLKTITISSVPSFTSQIFVEVYDSSEGVHMELLATSDRADVSHSAQSLVLNVELAGDILISVKIVRSLLLPYEVCRFSFHTGMVDEEGVLVFRKREIDTAAEDERFPVEFQISLDIHPGDSPYVVDESLWRVQTPSYIRDGSICFLAPDALDKAIQLRDSTIATIESEKGGYLTKQGEKVKSWKRRWFVLKGKFLSYFNQPKDVHPLGVIPLIEVIGIESTKDSPYFEILTVQRRYPIMAANLNEKEEWLQAIRTAISHTRLHSKEAHEDLSKLNMTCSVSLLEIKMSIQKTHELEQAGWKGIYGIISFDNELYITPTLWKIAPSITLQHPPFLFGLLYAPSVLNILLFVRNDEDSPSSADMPIGGAYINLERYFNQKQIYYWFPTITHDTHHPTGVDVHLLLRFGEAGETFAPLSPGTLKQQPLDNNQLLRLESEPVLPKNDEHLHARRSHSNPSEKESLISEVESDKDPWYVMDQV